MADGYRADKVASRDTIAIQTFMDAYNNHGLNRVNNTCWGINFLHVDGLYSVGAVSVIQGKIKKEHAEYQGWLRVPEGRSIAQVIDDELRFIKEKGGRVHVFVNWEPYEKRDILKMGGDSSHLAG